MTPELVEKYGDRIYSHSVELEITTAADGKFMLPDDSILRNERILAMFVPDNQNDNASSPLGNTLISNQAVRSGYITLKCNNDEIISDHPLSDLLVTDAQKDIRHFLLDGFNPSKSYVVFGNTALLTDGESLMIQFLYEKQ